MFTGIVDHTGRLEAVEERAGGLRAWVSSEFTDLVAGESIAVDGACLTVTEPKLGRFGVDISSETLSCTVAGTYRVGTVVNLERAMRLGDRLGGHVVTGHVDHTARVERREPDGDCLKVVFAGIPSNAEPLLFSKGSVTVQGVSLTVNETLPNGFSVMLVPHTLGRTTLAELKVGAAVNVEEDWLAKLFLNARKGHT